LSVWLFLSPLLGLMVLIVILSWALPGE